jgi:hypothetical protein
MLPNMPTAFLSCTMQQHLDQYAKLFTDSIQFCHLCPPFPYHVHIQLFAIYAHLLFISLAFCHICILHTFSYHLTGNNFCLVHCTCTMYSTVCLKYSTVGTINSPFLYRTVNLLTNHKNLLYYGYV